jgi:hypothetical protein
VLTMSGSKQNCRRVGGCLVVFVVVAAAVIGVVYKFAFDGSENDQMTEVETCSANTGQMSECFFCIEDRCTCAPGYEGPGCTGNGFVLDGGSATTPTIETHWQSRGWTTCEGDCQTDGGPAAEHTRDIFCENVTYTADGILTTAGKNGNVCLRSPPPPCDGFSFIGLFLFFWCVPCCPFHSVVGDQECEQTETAVRRVRGRPCNAFKCGLAKMEIAFEINSPYAELVWSLSAYDAFEAVLGLEMRRFARFYAGKTMDVEVLDAGPGVRGGAVGGGGVHVRVAMHSSETDTDMDALLGQFTADLNAASVDPPRFFHDRAPFFYYLKSIVPGTVSSGQVTRTRYCVGDRKCSDLHRRSCSDHVGLCGPCNAGFSVDYVASSSTFSSSSSSSSSSSGAELSSADGLWQCFPDVDCAYATPHHCAANLFRQPCSRTPNTCGPCLPGFVGLNRFGDGNQACAPAAAVDCSGADDARCTALLRMPCQHTHRTCGPCMPGTSTSGKLEAFGGDANVPCMPLVNEEDGGGGVRDPGGWVGGWVGRWVCLLVMLSSFFPSTVLPCCLLFVVCAGVWLLVVYVPVFAGCCGFHPSCTHGEISAVA